ncbi:P-loop containing nucleoside triphosphate hydrolase protein [Meredithblackwellia eburnea MCA 4105]
MPYIYYPALLDGLFPRIFVLEAIERERQHHERLRAILPPPPQPPQPPLSPPLIAQPSKIPAVVTRPNARIIIKDPKKGANSNGAGAPSSSQGEFVSATTKSDDSSSTSKVSTIQLPELGPSSFAIRLIPLQYLEMTARAEQLQSANLYNIPLRHTPETPLYTFDAPSIREGWPPVDLGDQLSLRQIIPDTHQWQGIHFEASVDGINRQAGSVTVRCDGLRGLETTMRFNVCWKVQERTFHYWRRSIELVDYQLNISQDKNIPAALPGSKSVAESWLFPTPDDLLRVAPTSEADVKFVPVDASLNPEQKKAVESICWGKHTVPFLISGPPGTGKTKTLVEAVLQILQCHPETHILVCGASNPAADTLATRLAKSLSPRDLFRLNHPSRPLTEVRGELLPFCHVEDIRFAMPRLDVLLSKRVIVTSCVDAFMLSEARCTNEDLGRLELRTLKHLHSHTSLQFPPPHFGYLLVDEAGQATEPDVLCPLSVVVSSHLTTLRAHVTICGDSKQLGPVIVGKKARDHDLDVSLLERLLDRPLYREHPLARKNRRKNPDVPWTMGCPFVNLTKNYRSATPILMLPSTLFYHESLEPFAPLSTQKSLLHNWSLLPNRGFPVHFHGLAGTDEPVDEGASFYNQKEVDYVIELVTNLVSGGDGRHGVVKPSEISIISPFREQVWRVRLALRKVHLGEVDVGNVEALQGAENRIVIISAVRSNSRWLASDSLQNRGLIHESKRWNVAMTRAKELLVVVGNAKILVRDPIWLALYRFCKRNGCYTGLKIEDPDQTGGAEGISRLEETWRRENRRSQAGGTGDGEREADWDVLVGSMVRVAGEGSDEEGD